MTFYGFLGIGFGIVILFAAFVSWRKRRANAFYVHPTAGDAEAEASPITEAGLYSNYRR
jgi:hypothetical protein